MNFSQQKTRVVQYEIKSNILLGQGSFGDVYKLVQGNKIYAVKRISKKQIYRAMRQKQLKREIQIMKKIDHENIIKFYDFKDEPNSKFYEIKLQYCEGTNLRNFLVDPSKYQKLVSPHNAKYFSIKVCLDYINALTEMRHKMISNRDIKPDNIIVSYSPNGKVTAKMIDLGQARFIIGQAFSFVGSNQYMAPQIKFAKGNSYNEACDLWSLGETMYQIMQGPMINKEKKLFLGSAFKQNFEPIKEADFVNYYNNYIFEGISFDKSKTPAPFRKIIRQLLRVEAEDRIKYKQMLIILIERFSQYQDCFNEQQKQFQKLRLGNCVIKQKQNEKKKQQIKDIFSKIKQFHKNLFLKILQNIQQNQYTKYPDIVRLLKLIIVKIHFYLKQVISIWGDDIQKKQSNQAIKEDEEFIFEEIISQVITKDQYQHLKEIYASLEKTIKGNTIKLVSLTQNINNFILTKFGELCVPIFSLVNKFVQQY